VNEQTRWQTIESEFGNSFCSIHPFDNPGYQGEGSVGFGWKKTPLISKKEYVRMVTVENISKYLLGEFSRTFFTLSISSLLLTSLLDVNVDIVKSS